MNPETANRASGAALAVIIGSLIFAVLVVVAKFSIFVPAVDADRGAVISKALAAVRADDEKSLNTPGWVDQQKGIVRLPIETAMQAAEREWQNPAQARADLISRAAKAAAPAPAAPAKPSQFE